MATFGMINLGHSISILSYFQVEKVCGAYLASTFYAQVSG